MKKIYILILFIGVILFSGCNMNLSNFDIQKLNKNALQYMEAGEYDKAISRLEAIIDLNPNLAETYYNLGIAYYNTEEYEKSVQAFDEAIVKKHDFADAYYSRAVAFEDWSYAIIDSEETKIPTKEESDTSLQYLKNAKSDFENYLEINKSAKDKEEVLNKIKQLDEKLNGEQPAQTTEE